MRERAELQSPGAPEEVLPKLVGVVLDGRQIGFVLWRSGAQEGEELPDLSRYRTQLSLETEEGLAGRFQELGPNAVPADSVTDLLLYLRALSRRPLEAEALADEFGPDGETAGVVVKALYDALQGEISPRTAMLYQEWLRLFGAVYGDTSSGKTEGTRQLGAAYGLPDDDLGQMLFAVHTYFALIMKILAVELVALQAGAVVEPLVAGLSALPDAQLEQRFEELESGAAFRARGVENFLEGDFLGWYSQEWSPPLRAAIRTLSRQLQEFEPATATLRPDLTQDLLKGLYHRLLPSRLRHDLGEYYTPDWLAEHTVALAGYEGEPGSRMLDPACGSGTFLVAAIRRMKDRAIALGLAPPLAAQAVVNGIVGFDLNPLAVIAARTNYLIAAGDLVREMTPFRIPVYICDSITVPAQREVEGPRLQGLRLATSVGNFTVPDAVASPERLPSVVSELEFYAENAFPSADFLRKLEEKFGTIAVEDRTALIELYERIATLKDEGRDGIWPRLLSNAFAPIFEIGGFDFVIGNPPWISWESVSQDYREATRPLWQEYGLFSLSGSAGRLGGGKKDMSMLMTMVALEEYLKPHGVLTFLITQTVLQTTGAGDGFRSFATHRRPVRVRSADDLANFNPFDDAANWTAILSLERDAPTEYPVDYTLWNKLEGVRIGRNTPRALALASTERQKLQARPVRTEKPTSPWLIGTPASLDAARHLTGRSDYTAKAGITVWLDGVYQLEVCGTRADGLVIVKNHAGVGKTPLRQLESAIEPDLLFPYTPWKNIGRWTASADRWLLVPQDPETRAPYPIETMQSKWPRTLAYLNEFEDQLRARSGYRKYYETTDPFYGIYNVAPETLSEWKTVWTTMGSGMQATAIGPSAGPNGDGSRQGVVKNTVILVAVDSEDEAWYLAALLNSSWLNYLLRASNVRGGKSAFPTSLLQAVDIPAFDSRRPLSLQLARLGRQAATDAGGEDERLDLSEHLVDEAAAEFWRIPKRSQDAMVSVLKMLR